MSNQRSMQRLFKYSMFHRYKKLRALKRLFLVVPALLFGAVIGFTCVDIRVPHILFKLAVGLFALVSIPTGAFLVAARWQWMGILLSMLAVYGAIDALFINPYKILYHIPPPSLVQPFHKLTATLCLIYAACLCTGIWWHRRRH
jgi:hypothetical protein